MGQTETQQNSLQWNIQGSKSTILDSTNIQLNCKLKGCLNLGIVNDVLPATADNTGLGPGTALAIALPLEAHLCSPGAEPGTHCCPEAQSEHGAGLLPPPDHCGCHICQMLHPLQIIRLHGFGLRLRQSSCMQKTGIVHLIFLLCFRVRTRRCSQQTDIITIITLLFVSSICWLGSLLWIFARLVEQSRDDLSGVEQHLVIEKKL